MDRIEQRERQGHGQGQHDLSQSDFRQSDQGTGTSETHTGHSWDPAVGDKDGSDHPQTTKAEPTEEDTPGKSSSGNAAHSDGKTGGH